MTDKEIEAEKQLERQRQCEHWYGETLPDGRLRCRCGATYRPRRGRASLYRMAQATAARVGRYVRGR